LNVLVNDFGGKVPPWEEENGFYAMTVRVLILIIIIPELNLNVRVSSF